MKRNTRKYLVAGGGVLVVAAMVIGALALPTQVRVARVQHHTFETYVQSDASVRAETGTVSAAVAGRVTQVYIKKGTQVALGTTLVALDDTEANLKHQQAQLAYEMERKSQQAQKEQAIRQARQATLLSAQAGSMDLEQFNSAVGTTLLSQYLSDEQIAQQLLGEERLKVAALTLQAAADLLELYTYRAPTPGRVTEVYVSAGQVVAAGTPLMKIAKGDTTYLQAELSDSQAAGLVEGMRVEIYSGIVDEVPQYGTVTAIETTTGETVLGSTSKTTVRIQPDQEGDFDRYGAKWNISILTQRKEALAVPLSAVFQQGNSLYVYETINGRTQAVPVETGSIDGEYVEIRSTLTHDAAVVIHPETVKAGARVVATYE
ncbi:MAG: biotin/lipoyl-binding protein [Eubacteriales bacterium]|nr:biotin/lipoyl-binding protein [Eubacteriales bacterium]